MSESLILDKGNEDFVNKVDKFKLMCSYYQDKDKLFKEDLLFSYLNDIYVDMSKNSNGFNILVTEKWSLCVTSLFKIFMERNNWDLFTVVSNFILSITDQSVLICSDLMEVGFGNIIIDMYLKTEDNPTYQSKNRNLYIAIISIVHNIARHVHLQQFFLQHCQIDRFKRLIYPLRSDKDDAVSIVTTFVLIWLAKEEERGSEMLKGHDGIIKIIFQTFKKSFESEKKRYGEWSMWELLQGLQALSSMDSMKSQIISLDEFLPILISIMTSDTSTDKEVELCLGILWNLSFVKDYVAILKTKYIIESIIEPLTKNDAKTIRHNAKGLLWNLQKSMQTKIESKNFEYDIFISYSHGQMSLVSKIEDDLKKNFSVWIDKNNIKGSSLDDMAAGIERSRVFVMCVSNSYKQSQFCHSEANYAYKMKKPIIPLIMEHKYKPDGWLGIMISSEFYIDVSEPSKLPDCLTKLSGIISYKSESKEDKNTPIKTSSEVSKPVKNWTVSEVAEWFSTNAMSNLKAKFEEFDGEMIEALVTMRLEAPQIYYDSLERKLQLTLPEILKFSSALSKLFK